LAVESFWLESKPRRTAKLSSDTAFDQLRAKPALSGISDRRTTPLEPVDVQNRTAIVSADGLPLNFDPPAGR
jgi:hypothetical protein